MPGLLRTPRERGRKFIFMVMLVILNQLMLILILILMMIIMGIIMMLITKLCRTGFHCVQTCPGQYVFAICFPLEIPVRGFLFK